MGSAEREAGQVEMSRSPEGLPGRVSAEEWIAVWRPVRRELSKMRLGVSLGEEVVVRFMPMRPLEITMSERMREPAGVLGLAVEFWVDFLLGVCSSGKERR